MFREQQRQRFSIRRPRWTLQRSRQIGELARPPRRDIKDIKLKLARFLSV
jgi:hypothetical protein